MNEFWNDRGEVMFRRIVPAVRIAIIIALVCMVTGCLERERTGQPIVTEQPDLTDDAAGLQKIKDRGKLVVAAAHEYPFLYRKEDNGGYEGYHADIANKIAERIGVPLEWTETDPADLAAAVRQGLADLSIGRFYPGNGASRGIALSESYLYSGVSIVKREEDAGIRSLADLTGKIVAVGGKEGLAMAQAAEERMNGAEIAAYLNMEDALQAVRSGKADAALNDFFGQIAYNKQHPDAGLAFVEGPITQTELAVGTAAGNDALLALVNGVIGSMKTNGEFETLYLKWLD